MKKCLRCEEVKPLTEFYKKEKRLHHLCKPCFNKYCSERWIGIKKKAIEYKGGCCQKCGYDKYYGALEFHHTRDKDSDWTKIRLKKWNTIQLELDKCILLCSNCHREEHMIG